MIKKNKNMNILLTFNDTYVEEVKILLSSLLLYNNYNFNIYIIYTDINKHNLNDLKKFINSNIGNIKFINITNLISKIDLKIDIEHITKEAYYRLFAPYVIDEEIDKILYLDCDLIINGDIYDLYNTSLDDKIIAGVVNFDSNFQSYNFRLGLPINNQYINSGVLLIDINKFREHISLKQIINYIEENNEILVFPDQDIINSIFYGKIKLVDIDYNYQITMIEGDTTYSKAKIIHYLYKYKPWNENFPFINKGKNYYKLLYKLNKKEYAEKLICSHIKSYEKEKYDSSNYPVTLSIIVLICDNTKHLKKCLKSINSQNIKDIEVLLIDVNSTNVSKIICDEYSKKDDRFKYIYKKCNKISTAKNIGIKLAKGKYLTFVDGNDYVDKNIYLESLNYMVRNNLKLVCVNYYDVADGTINKNRIRYNCNEIISGINMYNQVLLNDKMSNYAWSKVVESAIMKKIKFYESKYYEDISVTIPLLEHVNEFGFIHSQLYYYNHENISKTYDYKKIKDGIDLNFKQYKYMQSLPIGYQKNNLYNLINTIVHLYFKYYDYIDKKIFFNEYKDLFKEILFEYKKNNSIILKSFDKQMDIIENDFNKNHN